MKISHHEYGHVCVLTLSGDLTADDAEHFKRAAADRLAAGARHILLDCENLDFVDSAGLEAWLRLQENLGEKGGQLRLVRPDDAIATILRLTRLDLAFEIHPTVEAAVKSLR